MKTVIITCDMCEEELIGEQDDNFRKKKMKL